MGVLLEDGSSFEALWKLTDFGSGERAFGMGRERLREKLERR